MRWMFLCAVLALGGCEIRSGTPRSCCKVCKGSRACGSSCISYSKTCKTFGGCACQG